MLEIECKKQSYFENICMFSIRYRSESDSYIIKTTVIYTSPLHMEDVIN